jgi:ABC-type molybdate transport system substrate-binding protein
MEFHGIDEFMLYLKTQFDRSERKQDWRALTGRDHVSSAYDTFIFTDQKVFQVKAKEFAPKKMASVACEVGDPSPDLLELIKAGAPVPLNVISRAPSAYSVIMFGMQQYSSEVSDTLCREYYSSRQDRLESDLSRSLKVLLERPDYRRAYRDLRESQEGYFA